MGDLLVVKVRARGLLTNRGGRIAACFVVNEKASAGCRSQRRSPYVMCASLAYLAYAE
jgi:hypothetical protein